MLIFILLILKSNIPTSEIETALSKVCRDTLQSVSEFSFEKSNKWNVDISRQAVDAVSTIFAKSSTSDGKDVKILCTTTIIEKKVRNPSGSGEEKKELNGKDEVQAVRVTTAAKWDPETDGLINFKYSDNPVVDVVLVVAYIG